MRRTGYTVSAFAIFAGLIVASNAMLQAWGLWSLPWGWTFPAGTLAAAGTWPARDVLSRFAGPRWGPWAGLLAVFSGAALAYLITPVYAVASASAYAVSEGTDWALFWAMGGQRLRGWRYVGPVAVSTVIAAGVDSFVFLSLAHIPFGAAMPGLLFVKWSVVLLVGLPAAVRLQRLAPA